MPDGATNKAKARISSKGQVVLPKAVRERYGWTAGTELEIEDGPGGVLLKAAKPFPPSKPEEVFGMLKKYYSGPPKTIDEMNAGIAAEALRRHARGRY